MLTKFWRRLKMNTSSNGLGCYTRRPMCVIREILPFPQGLRALHKGLQRPKGADRRAHTKREVAKVRKEWRFQQIQGR